MIRSSDLRRLLRPRLLLIGLLGCAWALQTRSGRADEAHGSGADPEPARHAPTAENMAMARESLKDGMAQRDAGDAAGALPKLHLAYVLVATPVTGYELGKTYMTLGRLLSAREAFISVARMPRTIEESDRSENARRESERLANELEPHIPKLHIHVTLPPGAVATVSVDGAALLDEAVMAPHSVNPGVHDVTAKAGDGEPVSTKVEVHADETKDVTLAPKWVAPKPPPTLARPYYVRSSPNPLLYVGVVAGVVGTVVGTTTLILSITEQSAGLAECGANYCPHSTRNHFEAQAGYAVTALVAGGLVVAGVGTSLWAVFNPKTDKVYTGIQPIIGPGIAGLRGTF